MELRTTGDNINSWVELEECKALIAEVPNDAIGFEPADDNDAFEFEDEDIPLILESQRQISALYYFKGDRTDPMQKLAWPRVGFVLGRNDPGPNWFADAAPHLDASWADLAYHYHYELGNRRNVELASDVVPQDIKEAAVILAALRKNGYTLYEDNKGDQTTYSLGPISGDNINAVSRAYAVRERMARWGLWQGNVAKAGGAHG